MEQLDTRNQAAFEKGWARVLLFLPVYLAVLVMSQLLALPVIYALPDWDIGALDGGGMGGLMSLPSLLIMQGITTIGGLALVWVFARNIDKTSFMSLGLRVKGYLKGGILGFVLGIGLIGLGFWLLYILGYVAVEKVQFEPLYLLGYGVFTVFVAVNEEVVVRGYVLNNLMQSVNRWWALVLSAVFFTLLHSFNPGMSLLAIFNLFLAGLLLGIYYIYRKNLWFPIMLHLSWNFFQGSVFGFEVSGVNFSNSIVTQRTSGPDWLSGGMFGFEGSILLTLLNLLALAGLYFYFEKQQANSG